MFWTPKWKKEAKLVLKGSKKFVNFKRDLMTPEDMVTIRSRQKDVKEALKSKDKKLVKNKCNLLEQECKRSVPGYVRPSWIAENTEAIFVAVAIILGLKAYYIQPFRIPTGSMQPTLNGINGHKLDKEKWPSYPERLFQYATHGRSYIDLTAEKDDVILGISEYQSLKFFTKTRILFQNKGAVSVSSSASAISQIASVKFSFEKDPITDKKTFIPIPVSAGQVIAQGFVDTGDLVLVDKFSYHFRKPTRGETFVFDTRNIEEIHSNTGRDQDAGSHYIKRCVGVPGDTLTINANGQLMVNDKIPTDRGLVYAQKLTYPEPTRRGYDHAKFDRDREYSNLLDSPDKQLSLKGLEHQQHAEYAAFGDNTGNSLDSRYWGAVKQYNLVGPALFSLWPFKHHIKQHWGPIK